jgi:WASH complex subunit CCDC53
LLNNFIVSSTSFLNTFTENAECKISKISNKITELEILLAVLEAKLNSVPGLETQVDTQPSPNDSETAASHQDPIYVEEKVDNTVPSIPVEDRSKYAEFEKMLKVGVPAFVVEAKMVAAGLDPSILQTFDR